WLPPKPRLYPKLRAPRQPGLRRSALRGADLFEGAVHRVLEPAVAGVQQQQARGLPLPHGRQTEAAIEARFGGQEEAIAGRLDRFEETQGLSRLSRAVG